MCRLGSDPVLMMFRRLPQAGDRMVEVPLALPDVCRETDASVL